jgi:hypothetical protein
MLKGADPERDARWVQDINRVAETLPRVHPNFFNRGSAEEFAGLVRDTLGEVSSRSDGSNCAAIARLFAFANDGHTAFSLLQSGTRISRYPIRFVWLDDGLFVTEAPLTDVAALGSRVVSLQQMDIEAVHRRCLPYISAENDLWSRVVGQSYLTIAEVLNAADVVAPGADLAVETTTRTFSVPLRAVATATGPQLARPLNPLFARNPQWNYWFDYIPESRTIYIKYNRCQQSPTLSILSFATELSDFVATTPAERVIFDLRNNPGGSSTVLQPILQGVSEARRAGVPAAMNIYCIISRQTYSSGVLNAVDLKRIGAILVGEPCGWNPSGFGEVLGLTLPASGLSGSYSTRKFSIPDAPGPLLAPDIAVPYASNDYFHELDPLLRIATENNQGR